ncbi:MAG: DUF2065 domain-containing protein [Alphaproteobacteria bacterium]
MSDLLTAIGLALAIEGALYALFPQAMRRVMLDMLQRAPHLLRTGGIAACVVGVGIVWMVRA